MMSRSESGDRTINPRKGIFRYSNYQDGSESHPGRVLLKDIRGDDEHAEVRD